MTLDGKIEGGNISDVTEPRLIGDVLVLPDYSFANSMNERYGDTGKGQILVIHHYTGSWKMVLVVNFCTTSQIQNEALRRIDELSPIFKFCHDAN